MTKPALFKQTDVSKVLRGAKAAGVSITRVEIDRSGKIVAYIGPGGDNDAGETEWDRAIRAKEKRAS